MEMISSYSLILKNLKNISICCNFMNRYENFHLIKTILFNKGHPYNEEWLSLNLLFYITLLYYFAKLISNTDRLAINNKDIKNNIQIHIPTFLVLASVFGIILTRFCTYRVINSFLLIKT